MNNINYQTPLDKVTFNRNAVTTSALLALAFAGTGMPTIAQECFDNSSSYKHIYPQKLSLSTRVNFHEDFSDNSLSWQSIYSRLEEIKHLPNNWNGYGASIIDNNIIESAGFFLSFIPSDMLENISIFPTANGSIQIECERENNVYCEAEIFQDKFEIYAEKYEQEIIDESYSNINDAAVSFKKIYNS